MRQRVGLAIACMGDAAVLLLDEPSVGLDPHAAVEFRRAIRRFADAGRTVVVSSHSLPELERVCDAVAMLLNGEVLSWSLRTCSGACEPVVELTNL